jgi:L-seryl-tRNA(Ser) seleniumtransferase
MHPAAAAAMASAAGSFVELETLLKNTGDHIARILNVEAALVTAGASPGIILAAAACIAAKDPCLRNRLPADPPEANEIVIMRCHRNPYDNAVPTAGARFREIGDSIKTHGWELENSITERTAAVFYALQAEMLDASLSLDETLDIAHRRGIPVIVDAAAELPPKSNLWTLVQRSADVVLFSGGKDIRGPQASGLMIGKKDIVEAALFHGAPNYGVGRPMKASKETVVGLTVALECYLEEDEKARFEFWRKTQSYWIAELNKIPGVFADEFIPTQPGIHPINIPKVKFTIPGAPAQTEAIVSWLKKSDPGVIVESSRGNILLNPQVLEENETEAVITQIKKYFETAPH